MKSKRAFLLRWHWRVGVAASIFLLLIAITGLLLNHSRTFGLHRVHLEAPWLMSAYNMDVPEDYVVNVKVVGDTQIVRTKDTSLTLSVDQEVEQVVAQHYRGKGISLEKLILDLHSGKIIGMSGTLLSDLVALAIIFLTSAGLYNVWRRKRK